jgi:hypothetical protein
LRFMGANFYQQTAVAMLMITKAAEHDQGVAAAALVFDGVPVSTTVASLVWAAIAIITEQTTAD